MLVPSKNASAKMVRPDQEQLVQYTDHSFASTATPAIISKTMHALKISVPAPTVQAQQTPPAQLMARFFVLRATRDTHFKVTHA